MTKLLDGASTACEEQQVRRVVPDRRKIVVGLNIGETRTRNFIGELERRGFRVMEFETPGWSAVFFRLPPFVKALHDSNFVICGTGIPFQIPWVLLARIFHRFCVVDCPMDLVEWPFLTRRRWKWLVKLALRSASCVLTIKSRAYLVDKFGLDERRVKFVESCPDRRLVEAARVGRPHFRARPGAFLICCSGGHPHHRLERFLPIFHSLLALVPNVELLIIADPGQKSVVEGLRYAQSASFIERVHTSPVIRPAADFYATLAQCHMWVATLGDDTLQGRQEFRMELLEAGLLGQAVIAVATPALVEHGLTDGREILYIDPTDPEESALKIAGVANNRTLLAQLCDRLRSQVSNNYSLEKGVDEILDALQQWRG